MSNPHVEMLGLKIRAKFDENARFVSFLNPYSIVKLHQSGIDENSFSNIEFYSDGFLLCLIAKILFRRKIQRLSFDYTSLAGTILGDAVAKGHGVAIVGGGDGVAAKFKNHCEEGYGGIRVLITRSGFFRDAAEMKAFAEQLARSEVDLVVVGMGVILQEQFLLHLSAAGYRGRAFTCGGFLDQTIYAGGDYYPKWVDQTNMRWAYRIYREPRRLLKRYILDYPRFLGLLISRWSAK